MALQNFSKETKAGLVEGQYDSKFQSVVDAFIENYESAMRLAPMWR